MAFGGWQAAVPSASENVEAAWNFIEFLSNPENSSKATVTGGSGVNPYRTSHFENMEPWLSIFSEPEAKMYLAAQRESLEAPNVALDMRLPGYFSSPAVLAIELSTELAGDVPPQERLHPPADACARLPPQTR